MVAALHLLAIERNGIVRITVHGEIDASNAADVEAQVRRELGGSLRLSLSELEFIDSSGVAMVLRLAAAPGTVVVAAPGSVARRTFDIMGLTELALTEEPPG